jgi:hypothetical protein
MNLKPLGMNKTELKVNDTLTVLFSYETPVACFMTNLNGGRLFYKTAKKWSNTTIRHINSWLERPSMTATQPQEYFDNLIAGVK